MGTGVTTPLAMSFVRMRPTIETETSIPSRRKRTASLRLPHIELSARSRSILRMRERSPTRLTLPARPSRARLESLFPTVERGPARPDGAGRLLGRGPARAGAPLAFEGVSPDGCEL